MVYGGRVGEHETAVFGSYSNSRLLLADRSWGVELRDSRCQSRGGEARVRYTMTFDRKDDFGERFMIRHGLRVPLKAMRLNTS
jgi:hypothetical protein